MGENSPLCHLNEDEELTYSKSSIVLTKDTVVSQNKSTIAHLNKDTVKHPVVPNKIPKEDQGKPDSSVMKKEFDQFSSFAEGTRMGESSQVHSILETMSIYGAETPEEL